MSRENIIDKIQSLFNIRIENGNTKEEALTAALMAQKLIAKYDVKDEELFVQESYEIVEVFSKNVTRKIKYRLAMVIADNYRCCVYFSTGGRKCFAVFVGRELDAEAAKLVFENLYDATIKYGNSQSWKYRGMGNGLYGGYFNSACEAFIDGIKAELEKQCKELMLVRSKDVDDRYREATRGSRRIDGSISTFGKVNYESGVSAGRAAVQSRRVEGQKALEA